MSYQKSWKNYVKALLSSAFILASVNSYAITIDDALIIAYENNYQIKAEAEQYGAAKVGVAKAAAGFLPTATFRRDNTRTKYDSRLVNNANGVKEHREDTFILSQPLFTGGNTVAQTGRALYAKDAEFNNYRNIMNQVSADTVQAYENVLATDEIYNINIENEKNFKQYLEYTKIRFEAGVVTRTDVLQSEVKYAEAISNKEKAYSDMLNSRATLQRLLGVFPEEKLDPIDIRKVVLPKDVAEFRDMAFATNPNLKSSDASQTIAKYDLGISTSRILPSVSLNAQKTRTDLPRATSTRDASTYFLRVDVPLFQNGSEYADIGEKAYLKQKAEYDYLETERKLEEIIITYWNKYNAAKYSVKFRKEGVDAAKLALEGVREEVNIGTKTTIDLLNAESDYFNAKVALRTTERDLVVSIYQILQIIGQLDIL